MYVNKIDSIFKYKGKYAPMSCYRLPLMGVQSIGQRSFMANQETYYFSGYGKTSDYLDEESLINYHIKHTLLRTQSMFEWDFGVDNETIDTRNFELLVQTSGFGVGIERDGKHYVLQGTLGGQYNQYYMPTKAIIANPYLDLSEEYIIDKDCIIFNNDGIYMGLYPIIKYYAKQLAENDISRRLVLINCRATFAFLADNDNAAKSAKTFLDLLAEGKQGVIVDKGFENMMTSLPLSVQGSAQTIIQLLEDKQYIKGSLWNDLGVQSNYNMKRETITANENILNVDSLLPTVDNMLYCRQQAALKYNKMFGTNWTVKLSSSWEKLRTEIKLSQERDFGDNKEQSNRLDNKENDENKEENNDRDNSET